jgi:hypothetical protein
MGIPFTQYLRPNGKCEETSIERSAEIEDMAREIIAAGFVFEAEVLTDDRTVSLTVANRKDEEGVAIVLVQNGPEVGDAVDRLVLKAHALLGRPAP